MAQIPVDVHIRAWVCDSGHFHVGEKTYPADAAPEWIKVECLDANGRYAPCVKYSPDQPREPAGSPEGGQFSDEPAGFHDQPEELPAPKPSAPAKPPATPKPAAPAKPAASAEVAPKDVDDWERSYIAVGKTWSPKQQKALRGYQGADYNKINSTLRKGGKIDTKDIDAAVAASPLKEETVLYRGTGQNFDVSGMKPGAQFSDKGFGSTSLAKERAGYTPQSSDATTVFKITAPKGTPAAVMNANPNGSSTFANEHEVLLGRNTKYQVTKVSKKFGRTIIEARIILDDGKTIYLIQWKADDDKP